MTKNQKGTFVRCRIVSESVGMTCHGEAHDLVTGINNNTTTQGLPDSHRKIDLDPISARPFSPKSEPTLLALYASETKSRNGKPILIQIPDLSQPSLYRIPRRTTAAAAANNRPSVGLLSLPLEPQIAVKSLSIAITSRSRRCRVGLNLNFSNPSLPGPARTVLVKESSTKNSKIALLFRILEVSCLGSKVFKTSSVVYACWSPHIPEESVVLLESGALFLFDLESCFRRSRTSNSNARFRGTKLPVSWDADADSGNCKWLSCEFSWHPRILIVARSDAVFLVDLRFDGRAHKKELALGFVILNKDLSAMLSESNEFGGFTLIRLMSSGKLESQSYCVLWKLKELHTEGFHFKDNSLYIMDDEDYKFPRGFKYVKLDKLSAYLNGSLTEVLVSKLKKPCKCPREKESFSSESHEILCEKLKACGFGRLRSSPAVSVVFNDISLPASIHEVALRRLWAGLPMELLQLAYSIYSKFLEVANEMALSYSSCELHGDQAVSLADEREDMWGSSQKPKPFCLYHLVAFKCSTMDHVQENIFKDEKFDNLIFKVPEKKHVPNGLVETVGPELFDDLCPADLRFDTSAKNFGPNELKIYKTILPSGSKTSSSSRDEFVEDVTTVESATTVKKPIRFVYSDTSTKSLPNSDDLDLQDTHIAVSSQESRSTRVLSMTDEEEQDQRTNLIKEITDSLEEANDSNEHDTDTTTHKDIGEDTIDADDQADQSSDNASQNTQNVEIKDEQQSTQTSRKDSELPRNAYDKLKAMQQTLAKGKLLQDDCASVVKKLRAMLHSTEEQLRVHKKQTIFLTQLTAKMIPKAAVVVNSTITYAKESWQDPLKHVFHILTDRLNYAAMRMWFLVNPPGKASIQVQNVEEFTWLNASYSPVLKQLGSQSMIDYNFRAHRANSDSNLKYRNPKYLSILNHLRFYLPEIFPKLNKVLFLDDDIIVKKDLPALWSLDLKGNVNGAVETCGECFHHFDRLHISIAYMS
nr:putative galacturonosyltransferase 4 [Quercus suber]